MFVGLRLEDMERAFVVKEPTVKGFNKMNKYLASLFVAIKKVSNDYIRYTYHIENPESPNANEKSLERSNDEISHVERVFAYELYRQWCELDIIKYTKGLVVNAEIPKQFIDATFENKGMLCYPDILLHYGQNDYKHNYIICEIKRKEYVDSYPQKMNDDINKLLVYVGNNTFIKKHVFEWKPFNVGVFLMTVKALKTHEKETYSLNLITKHLNKEILDMKNNQLTKKIVCSIYDGKELKYDTLYNIINNI